MLTDAEKTKFRLIKEAAQQGRAAEVLRAAAKDGYNVQGIPALL